jgi:predicted DCC family thiol-disulfide oxidoreductase YuxK
MQDNQDTHHVIVLFDGACPLCSKEIAHYQKRRGASLIEWVDVNTGLERLNTLGIDQQTALAKFHVRDAQGQWQVGASAFVLLWSQLRPYSWLARLVNLLHLVPLMDRGYAWFLRRRGRRQCDAQRCDVEKSTQPLKP